MEKNKKWLLPLLALGVGGVLYLNIGTFSSPPEAAPAPSPAPSTTSAAAPNATPAATTTAGPVTAPPPAPPAPPPAEAGSDIWSDLKAMALVPNPLGQDEELQIMARAPLDIHSPDVSGPVPHPGGIRDPKPVPVPGQGLDAALPPDVDFLVLSPSGPRAWFDGHGYRPGETLNGKPFTVGPIASSNVELKGPSGRTLRWTNSLHRPGPKAPPSPESP